MAPEALNSKTLSERSEACKASVYARYRALKAAQTDIEKVPRDFLVATVSVVEFAKLDLPQLGITALARNTLYKYSNQLFQSYETPTGESGWKYLDWLRREVKKQGAIKSAKSNRRAQYSRLKKRLHAAREQNRILQETLVGQSKAYLWLLKELSALAYQAASVKIAGRQLSNVVSAHDKQFGYLFKPDRKSALDSDKIVPLKKR